MNRKLIYNMYSNENIKDLGNKWHRRATQVAKITCKTIKQPFSLLDFGCCNMNIEKTLQEMKCNFTYFPSDIIKRDNRTIVFDLNTNDDYSIIPKVDIITMMGVLEYVTDYKKALKKLLDHSSYIIFTYRKNWRNAVKGITYYRTTDEILKTLKELNMIFTVDDSVRTHNVYIITR